MFPTGSSPLTRGKPDFIRWTLMAYLAHPRSRGENFPDLDVATAVAGSSPLTRGKPRRDRRDPDPRRLIPAHAGKTSRRACRSPPIWAHPRSRGENLTS